MGPRDAATAPHPPPAPDWILGSDGHWKPPPLTGEAPRRRPGVTTVVVEPGPADHKVGPAVIVAMILVIAAVSYLAWVAVGA